MDEGEHRKPVLDRPVRVMLLLESLHGGGAERVAAHLARSNDPAVTDIRFALIRKTGPFIAEIDDDQIDLLSMTAKAVPYNGPDSGYYRPDRMLALATLPPLDTAAVVRKRRPDVVMSFLKGMNLAAYGAMPLTGPQRPRWIAREGNHTGLVIESETQAGPVRSMIRSLTRRCYQGADCCLANSRGLADMVVRDVGVKPERMRVIPNPVDIARVRRLAAEPLPAPPERPFVVAAGRLDPQKAHDLLIRAFAAAPACRALDLVILGTGREEAALRRLAAQLGVAERVRFAGFVANPWAYFAKAELFVLASHFEGFPSVVAEALACGAPVLVTDCPYGPSEMVEDDQNGWIIPAGDADRLSSAMQSILEAPGHAAEVATRGPRSVQRFDLPHVVEAYSRLFIEQALARPARLRPRLQPAES